MIYMSSRVFPKNFLLLLAGLLLFCGCESPKTIVHDLTEREANEILVFLEAKGVNGDKVKAESGGGAGGGEVKWNIFVPESQSTQAMALLNEAGLPRQTSKTLLQIFEQQGLVPSEQQEQIRFRAGLEQELANTIRKIDGVLQADVRLSFPKEDPLNPQAPKGKMTASVFVKHNGILDDPNSLLVIRIRDLVASSINGLSFDDVTIVSDRARIVETDSRRGRPEKELVSVWTLIIAKESVTRFRVIFFSFFVTLLILLILVALLLWKISPFLRKAGGFDKLFSPQSLMTLYKERMMKMKRKKMARIQQEEQAAAPQKRAPTPPSSDEEDMDEEDEEDEE